jgi:SNF2 family DNA or RNA helicase
MTAPTTACIGSSRLADDMGLGKTIQILSLLLVLKNEAGDA